MLFSSLTLESILFHRTVVLQQMAVQAAANAGNSAAAASTAVAGSTAGAGVGAGVSAGVSTGTTIAAVSGAIAAGVALTGSAALFAPGEICPEVLNHQEHTGSAAFRFLTQEDFLSKQQATDLETVFEEAYNADLGCASNFSRVAINCTIPCYDAPLVYENGTQIVDANGDEIFEERCCKRALVDDLIGSALVCEFECLMHCDGCNGDVAFSEQLAACPICDLPSAFSPQESLVNQSLCQAISLLERKCRNNSSMDNGEPSSMLEIDMDKVEKHRRLLATSMSNDDDNSPSQFASSGSSVFPSESDLSEDDDNSQFNDDGDGGVVQDGVVEEEDVADDDSEMSQDIMEV